MTHAGEANGARGAVTCGLCARRSGLGEGSTASAGAGRGLPPLTLIFSSRSAPKARRKPWRAGTAYPPSSAHGCGHPAGRSGILRPTSGRKAVQAGKPPPHASPHPPLLTFPHLLPLLPQSPQPGPPPDRASLRPRSASFPAGGADRSRVAMAPPAGQQERSPRPGLGEPGRNAALGRDGWDGSSLV